MTNLAVRWGGLLLIAGVALLVAALLIFSAAPATAQQLPQSADALMFTSSILLLLSLPAMYARQVNASGWLGLLGHALLQTGILLFVVPSAPALLYPSFDQPFEAGATIFLLGIALALGLLLTSIATLRAKVFPRGAGILLLAGTAGFFFDFFVADQLPPPATQISTAIMGVLLSLSLGWIGYSMFTHPPRPTA